MRDTLADYVRRALPRSKVEIYQDFTQVMDAMKKNPFADFVLMDLNMPHMNGLNGLIRFKDEYPFVMVGVLADLAKTIDVKQAIEKGACGYFPRTMDGLDFIDAINVVLSGQNFIPQCVTTNGNQNASSISFTPRELSVIECLARGESNKIIAYELDIQEVTVKMHLRNICTKLDVTNRTQAAIRALELGVLSGERSAC